MGIGDLGLGTIGQGFGGVLGIAGGVFGAITGSEDAKKMAGIQKQEIANEMQQDYVRRQAMELTVQRKQIQNVRSTQYARAMALQTGTNQGAQFGSGVQGAYGSISGQSNTNALELNQNLMQGRQMFDLTEQLSGLKMAMADAQGKAQEDQAIGGMFGSMGKQLGPLGNILSSFPGLMQG